MRDTVKTLKASEITSDVYVIAPTQIDRIAEIFADNVADTMNMRTFSQKIRQIARHSLVNALGAAKKMGEKN